MKTLSYDMQSFRTGLVLLNDDSTAPVGSAREMTNVFITDRGGIAPRPGTRLLGPYTSATNNGNGFYVFKKSYDDIEIPMRAYDDELEYYCSTCNQWVRLKNGFTVDQEFGFAYNFVTTENEDYVYFCNRYQPFMRWNGQIVHLTANVLAAATTIPVTSVLRADIFSSRTAIGTPTTTTIQQSGETWGVNQWRNMWVYMTSGTQIGRIRKIASNTADTLTFAALPVAPVAGDTFEVRASKFDISTNAKFIYAGTEITVTAIDKYNELTVASAHAGTLGDALTNSPQEYPTAPRGNRMTVLKGRTFVSRARSALSRDTGGTLQAMNTNSTLFGTKLADPTSFEFASPRVAGEGIIAAVPFGGTEVNDIAMFEDVVYVYKRSYIEAFQMGDTDDTVLRRPLKAEAGSINRVIVGRDDHYFITLDKQFTSLGRVEGKDFTPTTQNIGLPIKRLLDRYEFNKVNGIEYRNRLFLSAKSDNTQTDNNSTVVWNKTTQSFEGAWNIGAHGFGTYNDDLYYQDSSSPNVWRMFEDVRSDFIGTTELPISAKWQSNFYNLTPIKANYQGMNSIALEGFIAANATFTVSIFKEFSGEPAVSFDFGGLDDEEFLVGDDLASFLGANPLGLEPIGTVDAPGSDGRRRFQFLVYFPPIYGQYFSLGLSSSGLDQDWEIIRASLGVRESISTVRPNIREAL